MKICTLASSSSGNCTLLSSGDTNILVDAGISMRRIERSLRELDMSARELKAILVTHEHSDHICGIAMMAKYYSLPIIAPPLVAEGVFRAAPSAEKLIRVVHPERDFSFCGLQMRCFGTSHDVPQSVGYRFEDLSGRTAALITDTGIVSEAMLENILGVDAVVQESNYDPEMLRNGIYPEYLKKRIASRKGHLSNGDSADVAARLAESGTKMILLAHLSRENNTPRRAYESAKNRLESEGISVGSDVQLEVAPPDNVSKVYIY